MIASSSAWRESAKLGKSAKADIATAMSGTSESSVVSVIEDATSWSCVSRMRSVAKRMIVRTASMPRWRRTRPASRVLFAVARSGDSSS